MAVTVKVECQSCETIDKREVDGVLILGRTTESDEPGTVIYYHDLTLPDISKLLSAALDFLAEEVEKISTERK